MDEVAAFESLGFSAPFQVCDAQKIGKIRSQVVPAILADGNGVSMRHVDCAELYSLCSDARLLNELEHILGPAIVLWRSRICVKQPGGRGTPWHCDGPYFWQQLSPVVNVTAWIALDNVKRENACLRVIPGSQRTGAPHICVENPVDGVFVYEAAVGRHDEEQAIDLPMTAGECVLFSNATLHGSTDNQSDRMRVGLSIRFTIPSVHIKAASIRSNAVLVRGVGARQV